MFSKKNRLPIHKFFGRNKTVFSGEYLVVKTAQNNLFYNRVGVLIGKKSAKKATKRNELKRSIFNFLKDESSILEKSDKKGKDILFVMSSKKNEDEITKEMIKRELKKAVSKIT